MHYLIFDFDGVLGDSRQARDLAVMEVEQKSMEQVMRESEELFSKRWWKDRKPLSEAEAARLRDWYDNFAIVMERIGYGLFDEFIAEVGKIPDTTLAIVSSAYRGAITKRVADTGLTFTHILDIEDHHSKEEKIEQVCRDWGISPDQAYYFTDTLSDVHEISGMNPHPTLIGCAWGYLSYEKLAQELPESHILRQFSDIHRVIAS
jgi:FMN phosphatase YigB (HAD superfamily)